MLFQQRVYRASIGAVLQVLELILHVGPPGEPLAGSDPVAQERTDDKNDPFKFRSRNLKPGARDGRLQKGPFNRQMIVCGQVMSEHELVMGVHVDDLTCFPVETKIARNAGYLSLAGRSDLFEADLGQHANETLYIRSSNEEINVSLAPGPALALPVPLPLTMKHSLRFERVAQPLNQRQ